MRFFTVRNIELIDFKALAKILPGPRVWRPRSTQGSYIRALLRSQSVLERHGINTVLRIAYFIGQGLIETGFLRYRAENLNYGTDALLRVFPKYFADRTAARTYAGKPEKIANRVYANRMGNGDEASGDGWRYRRRGFFQLTGKDNYQHYGDLANIDLVGNPSVLEKNLKTSIEVAAAFFGKTGLGEFADENDIPAVSRGVNRGDPKSGYRAHSEDERIVWTRKILALVKDHDQILAGDSAAADDGVHEVGDSGAEIQLFQRKLKQLGFDAGSPDGIFGRNTRRAVVAFQDEYGLPTTGKIDAQTADAIDDALEDTRRMQSVERQTATVSDMRNGGVRDVSKTGQAGIAGAAAGAAGAVAIGNETGVFETVAEGVKEVSDPTQMSRESSSEAQTTEPGKDTASGPSGDDVQPDIQPPAQSGSTETTLETSVEQSPPAASQSAISNINWTTVALLLIIVMGVFIFIRSRQAVTERVDDYRSG